MIFIRNNFTFTRHFDRLVGPLNSFTIPCPRPINLRRIKNIHSHSHFPKSFVVVLYARIEEYTHWNTVDSLKVVFTLVVQLLVCLVECWQGRRAQCVVTYDPRAVWPERTQFASSRRSVSIDRPQIRHLRISLIHHAVLRNKFAIFYIYLILLLHYLHLLVYPNNIKTKDLYFWIFI